MQLPEKPITKLERKQLYKWWNFPSFAAQQRPATMKEGLRLSGTSKEHIKRLNVERDAARAQHARATGQDQRDDMRVRDWWIAQAEKRKQAERQKWAEEMAESGAQITKRQRDYERRRRFLEKKNNKTYEGPLEPVSGEEDEDQDFYEGAPEPTSEPEGGSDRMSVDVGCMDEDWGKLD
ncbi:MAG: hypothetical protein Q9191_002404 [Dirinaria sp. TL-2023a]